MQVKPPLIHKNYTDADTDTNIFTEKDKNIEQK